MAAFNMSEPTKEECEKVSRLELARYGAAVCTVEDQLYVWRGDTHDDDIDLNVIYTLDLNNCKRWRKIDTDWDNSSQPPLGKCSMAICSVGNVIYTFGGWYSDQLYHSRSNKLHALCLQQMTWREVVAVNAQGGPGMKDKCGMLEHDGKICIFGGYGYLTDHQKKNKLFSQDPQGFLCWTNELHLFDPITRRWSVPECTGTAPPPCAAFSFNKVDQQRALLFGGRQREARVNELHILNMDHWEWSGAIHPLGINCWPSPRSFHTAVCLHDPHTIATPTITQPTSQKLLVLWGMDQEAEPINDIWLLDVDEMKWSQLPCSMDSRVWHSSAAYYPSDCEATVLTIGGSPVNVFRYTNTRLAEIVKMEFGVKSLYRSCALYLSHHMDMFRPLLIDHVPAHILNYINKLK